VITILGPRRRTRSATSYAEVELAVAATDASHPAFRKLFIETSIDAQTQTISGSSAPSDQPLWLFRSAQVPGQVGVPLSFDTDRKRFIGRGRSTGDNETEDDLR